MSAPLSPSVARRLADRSANSLVLLEMPGRQGAGFIVSADGLVVTNLHVVLGVEEIHALLADGRVLEVEEVVAMDEGRDLAVLRVARAAGLEALRLSEEGWPREGEDLLVPLPGGRLSQTRVGSVQVLGDELTLLELEEGVAEDDSGAPVLDSAGQVVGVATCALADGRPVTLAIPARYLREALEAPQPQPLSALALERYRTVRQRRVPEHSLALLEGCATDSVESIATSLMEAIQVGAPAYNEGDIEGCYRLYAHTAEQIIAERPDCPGAQRALREGLHRCEQLESVDDKAWAMRDTFDGLLGVIERWIQAQAAFARLSAPKTYLQ